MRLNRIVVALNAATLLGVYLGCGHGEGNKDLRPSGSSGTTRGNASNEASAQAGGSSEVPHGYISGASTSSGKKQSAKTAFRMLGKARNWQGWPTARQRPIIDTVANGGNNQLGRGEATGLQGSCHRSLLLPLESRESMSGTLISAIQH